MDTSKDVCTRYTLQGREDNYGKNILEAVMRKLRKNCLDFIEEETMIETSACKMREHIDHIIVNHTPKCHHEIFVEDIEYSWVHAKNYHIKFSLDKKKGKRIFKKVTEMPYQYTGLPSLW